MLKPLSFVAAAGLLALSSAPVSAAPIGQPDYFRGDLTAFHGDSQSLLNALRTFHQTNRGRVLEIRFTDQGGVPGYRLVVQQGRTLMFERLDEGGAAPVVLQTNSEPDWMLGWQSRANIRFDRRAKISLADAIRTAERANGGAPAVAAGIATNAGSAFNDVHAFNVLLKNGDMTTKRVAVDASNGEIIVDPQALSSDF
jgi:uncharacterized membrane protein YkoI